MNQINFFFHFTIFLETLKNDTIYQLEVIPKETIINGQSNKLHNFKNKEKLNDQLFLNINDSNVIPKMFSMSTNCEKLNEKPKFHSFDSSENISSHHSSQIKQTKSLDSSTAIDNNLNEKKDAFDPFDVNWVSLATKNTNNISTSTNPFASSNTVKAFQVKM